MLSFKQMLESNDRKTIYPEYIGKKAKYNSSLSPEEKKKIHNNPQKGDIVLSGDSGDYGKIVKTNPKSVHIQWKGSKSTSEHSRDNHAFYHDSTYEDGTRKYQIVSF